VLDQICGHKFLRLFPVQVWDNCIHVFTRNYINTVTPNVPGQVRMYIYLHEIPCADRGSQGNSLPGVLQYVVVSYSVL